MISELYNYNDMFLAGLSYGYDNFVLLARNQMSRNGPVVQYVDAFESADIKTLIPVKSLQNNASQQAIYDNKLLGEGFDTTSFKLSKLSYTPSWAMPILCDKDNVPSDYVFELFDLARKAVYGDAVEHVVRISTVTSTTIICDSYSKFILQNLKNHFNDGHSLFVRIVDGKTLGSKTDFLTVTGVSVNDATITVAGTINTTLIPSYSLAVFCFYDVPTYPQSAGTPPSREDYEYSSEFYLMSSRDGLYYPGLIDSLSFKINASLPELNVNTFVKRLNKSKKLIYHNDDFLNVIPENIYSIPKCEQARIKIDDVNGKTLFYGLLPVVQTQPDVANPLFDGLTGIHFGNDTADLTEPYPLLIQEMDLNINNNLKASYTTHTPRFTFDNSEPYINDLGRQDNTCAYAFYSTQRKISGNIKLYIPQYAFFQKEFLPAISSSGEGSIEIDTGYLNFKMSNVVFNLSPLSSDISSEITKSVDFSFVSTRYDAMFEIGLSKTGGRI